MKTNNRATKMDKCHGLWSHIEKLLHHISNQKTRCFLVRRPTIKAYTRPLACRSPGYIWSTNVANTIWCPYHYNRKLYFKEYLNSKIILKIIAIIIVNKLNLSLYIMALDLYITVIQEFSRIKRATRNH